MTEPKAVKFCTQVDYTNSSNRMTLSPTKGVWLPLSSHDCFIILPFVVMPFWIKARVNPRTGIRWGADTKGKGQFSGVVRAIQKH